MKEKGAMKSIWHFLKEMWECSYDYLESVAEFLTRRKWWFIAILFFLIFIPVFLTFHYEKGLGVGDALFFTFAIIFGATIVAIIVVFSLIWLLMLTGRVIRYFKKENQAQPEEKEEKKVASPKELGPIDEERLAPYFKSTFKGMGGGKVNYFRILMDTMNTFRTESQRNVGAVALLIYQSDKLNNLKPDSFSKWIEIFFECMRLDVPADRSQNRYKLEKRKDKDMKLSRTFTYL